MPKTRERVVLERLRFDDGTFGPWRTPASDMDPVVKAFYEVQTFVPEGTQEEEEGLRELLRPFADGVVGPEDEANEAEVWAPNTQLRLSVRAEHVHAARAALSTPSEVGEAEVHFHDGPSGRLGCPACPPERCPTCGSKKPHLQIVQGSDVLRSEWPGKPCPDPFHGSREKT